MAALSAALCVAVITGSLIVGDSVRKSLLLRVEDRLFGTKSVVVAGDGFLAREALDELGLNESSKAVLLSDGFISRAGRLIPVMVWGMDALPDGTPLPEGKIAINAELAKSIDLSVDPALVLRLPDDGLVPSSSLFVTGKYTTSLRLDYASTVDAAHGGNLSLKNSQTIPCNVFVRRNDLCEALGLGDKINLILSPEDIRTEALSALTPATFGLRMEEGRIVSDRVFLKDNIVDKLTAEAPDANRLYSYLVNEIAAGGKAIPYSFATALDNWQGDTLPEDGAILSDYAARRLGVGKGGKVEVRYFVSDGLKNLTEKTRTFTVSRIVPITAFTADGALSADYPGLADAESCARWDSDLPIEMSRITDEDERYWDLYKSTPKILLPYTALRDDWANSWGDATQIRTDASSDILCSLDAGDFPVSVIHPYDEALANAAGGVDFGGLFLALGCFIVIAALLLLYGPLGEMYVLRSDELSLLGALGFSRKGISSLLLREVLPAATVGALAGIAAAVLYAGCIIFLLGNIWSGATHTDGFILYPKPLTLIIGLLAGLLLTLAVICLAIRKAAGAKSGSHSVRSLRNGRTAAIISTILLAASLIFGLVREPSVVVFVLVGCLCLAAGILWIRAIAAKGDTDGVSTQALTRQSLRHSLPEVMSGLVTLALGGFITFAVGLNRQDYTAKAALANGTGGFDWWCELTVPLQHDISTPEGRAALSLSGLGDDASVMPFTLVGGDDASCLNLNKVTTPSLLGFRERDFLESRFRIKENLFSLSSDAEVLDRMGSGDAIYGLVDETVLLWSMMKAVGDTLHYSGPSGGNIDVIIAGTLPNTALQGYVLIPEQILETHWPDRGSRLILVKSENPSAGTLLETALNEYGIRAVPATERLRTLGSVTDTYLTIFLMLGAIGLVLGVASFVLGVHKRLATKKTDIRLMRALGFGDKAIARSLARENTPIPVLAVILGLLSAVVSVAVSFGAIPLWTWAVCLITSLLSIFLILYSVQRMSVQAVNTTRNDEDTDH